MLKMKPGEIYRLRYQTLIYLVLKKIDTGYKLLVILESGDSFTSNYTKARLEFLDLEKIC